MVVIRIKTGDLCGTELMNGKGLKSLCFCSKSKNEDGTEDEMNVRHINRFPPTDNDMNEFYLWMAGWLAMGIPFTVEVSEGEGITHLIVGAQIREITLIQS